MTTLSPDPRFGPNKSVAVIGAGIAGVSAAAHLLKHGLSVTVFERSDTIGGIWHYDERTAADPPFPCHTPSAGDFRVSRPGEYAQSTPPPDTPEKDDVEVQFAPPGPCYAGLQTNIPTNVLVSRLHAWPDGTDLKVSQVLSERFIVDMAAAHGVDGVTRFRTRVDQVTKTPDGRGWEVRTVELQRNKRLVEHREVFDFVVAASGHYSMPRIPPISGLEGWKSAFPARLSHSKQYRRPDRFRGRTVLVVGAGVSAMDICHELTGVGATVYQSVRGGFADMPLHMLPPSTMRVGEIISFSDLSATSGNTDENAPIPGTVHLKDGKILDGIHDIVFATGYITTYPYLPQFHSDSLKNTQADERVLITAEGTMVHNLHRDIFYIPDPTLAFIGVPLHTASFGLDDFQSETVARVFTGKAKLPTEKEMRAEYAKKIKERGVGKGFHSLALGGSEVAYVDGLVEWMNRGLEEDEKVVGLGAEWVRMYEAFKREKAVEWFGSLEEAEKWLGKKT
ncbi:hypothetical protein QBC47DRAFT_460175 [Echria macrotheca]|uniref:Uncharacterized protein n=1 Tax=Echria macrotheca TaxID=438768 RepID=A0AAJ0FCN6_9PEZI|nr:hypothetical protein QBC47DRAFT_460175 [Echria macrotheca]